MTCRAKDKGTKNAMAMTRPNDDSRIGVKGRFGSKEVAQQSRVTRTQKEIMATGRVVIKSGKRWKTMAELKRSQANGVANKQDE